MEKAINSLIEDSLMVTEGGPTDSETLTYLFHLHGINMRYLGEVLKQVKIKSEERKMKFQHIEYLIEKEIFVRSFKHVFIKHMSKAEIN